MAEEQQTEPVIGHHEASGVSNRLGNPEPFFPAGSALSERAQLGMAHGEPRTGHYNGQGDVAEALVAPCSVEGRYGLPEAGGRPTIVALGMVSEAEALVC